MSKTLTFLIICVSLSTVSFGQRLSSMELRQLKKTEDSIKNFAIDIVQGLTAEDRFTADSQFTRMFVRALSINNSFYYPFDSLITISRLTAPDSTFKIFTWQLVVNDVVTRQHGAIQMNTTDGSLELMPLIDRSSVIEDQQDTIADNFGWVGAVYYKLVEKDAFGKRYYTLLGYDENDVQSNKKIIEVLRFDDGHPVFGGSFFSFPDNSVKKRGMARYIMEYKRTASPRLTYDPEMDMIVYEHLISETGEPDKKYTYIPDGDYEGLKWVDGKWVHINKVFTEVTPEGQEPVPAPLRDAEGNIDYSKLSQRTPEDESETPVVENEKKVKTKSSGGKTKTKVKN